MSKLSIRLKLGICFGCLLLIIAVMGSVGYYSVNHLAALSHRVDQAMIKKDLASQVEAYIEMQTTGARGYLLSGKQETLKRDEEGREGYQTAIKELDRLVLTEEGRRCLSDITQSYAEYRTIVDKEIELRRAGHAKEAAEMGFTPHMTEVRNGLRTAVANMAALQEKRREDAMKEQSDTQSNARILTLSLAMVGIILGLVIATLISRSLTNSIARMLLLIQEIAGNNLGVEDMTVTSEDELGKAGLALNQMKNSLRDMIQSIAGTAEHVASASEEISSSATQQAQGAETQKDQTAQVATAMQEMSSTVQQVSENSNRASDAARRAAETARHGGAIVEESLSKMRAIADSVSATARKMEELGKSSDQIGRIIGVIDDIADQTNLLALNAAIEAARAGEQGRGFAVVADEVRKLAERTTTATKEIAQMIKNIQDETKNAVTAMEAGTGQVEDGVKTTGQAGDSLKQIIEVAEQVGEMITHIATAATQQSSASEQVNNNMDQIAKLVRESAIGAQQSAKACQDLSGLALDLQRMVGNFKLGHQASGSSSHPHRTHLGSSAAYDGENTSAGKAFAAGAR
jgi:methyl-accepting chemotaxis protein